MSSELRKNLRVLVCGGRDFGVAKPAAPEPLLARRPYGAAKDDLKAIVERSLLERALSKVHRLRQIDTLIHGGAWGADNLAGRWAIARGIKVEIYPANWQQHGRRAGYLRNKAMLEQSKPHVVVAFPGGRGTANMTKLALDAGITVWEPTKDPV